MKFFCYHCKKELSTMLYPTHHDYKFIVEIEDMDGCKEGMICPATAGEQSTYICRHCGKETGAWRSLHEIEEARKKHKKYNDSFIIQRMQTFVKNGGLKGYGVG